jgi:thiazole synthase
MPDCVGRCGFSCAVNGPRTGNRALREEERTLAMATTMHTATDPLTIADRTFSSRLIVGTGKFSSPEVMADALAASGTEMVTVAIRRIDLDAPQDPITAFIDPARYLILANTSGAADASEAVRLARLARSAGLPPWIKVEVIPDPRYLMPDPVETLVACEQLVRDGFVVLPYIHADPVLAKRLEEVGCAAVMPLAAPIGSGKGLKMEAAIAIIIEQALVPVVVDAGLGVPSHAAAAMEMGADAVLVNTAIASAVHPARMAKAFALAVEAGRAGRLAGRAPEQAMAQASSPLTGFLHATD